MSFRELTPGESGLLVRQLGNITTASPLLEGIKFSDVMLACRGATDYFRLPFGITGDHYTQMQALSPLHFGRSHFPRHPCRAGERISVLDETRLEDCVAFIDRMTTRHGYPILSALHIIHAGRRLPIMPLTWVSTRAGQYARLPQPIILEPGDMIRIEAIALSTGVDYSRPDGVAFTHRPWDLGWRSQPLTEQTEQREQLGSGISTIYTDEASTMITEQLRARREQLESIVRLWGSLNVEQRREQRELDRERLPQEMERWRQEQTARLERGEEELESDGLRVRTWPLTEQGQGQCPSCGIRFTVNPLLNGIYPPTVQCPSCGTTLVRRFEVLRTLLRESEKSEEKNGRLKSLIEGLDKKEED